MDYRVPIVDNANRMVSAGDSRQRGLGSTFLLCALTATALTLCAGCEPQHRPIFDRPADALGWPPAPAPARIRYVGQLRGAEDLKAARNALEAIGALFAGEPAPKQLYGPRSCVRTDDGRFVWVADPGGRCLHQFDLIERKYLKITSAGKDPLLSPVDICLGPGNSILVCDSEAIAIHRYDATGGGFVGTLRLPVELSRPAAIAYDADRDELYVVDVSAHNVEVLDGGGGLLRLLGKRGQAAGEFNYPCDVAIDGETLWIVEAGNHRVQRITTGGEPISSIGQIGDAPGDLALPKSVALDRDGHVYVVDARFENIQVFDSSGRLLLVFGDEGSGPGEFWLPAGLFIDNEDRIWVCDTYNARLQVFDYMPDDAALTAEPQFNPETDAPRTEAGKVEPLPVEKTP